MTLKRLLRFTVTRKLTEKQGFSKLSIIKKFKYERNEKHLWLMELRGL